MLAEKTVLRQEIRKRLSPLPVEKFYEAGVRAADFFSSGSNLWQKYNTILLFVSMKNEIDTFPLIQAAVRNNKKIFLPRVEAVDIDSVQPNSEKQLNFYRVTSEELKHIELWPRSSFGIPEPVPRNRITPGDFPALIFTPGLAFDITGNRLGHGKGFYDRFFNGLKKQKGLEFTTTGLCLDIQIYPSVPVDQNDYKMDCVYHF